MFGAICGDTIGSTYEFDNTKDYGFELFPKGSSYTDDSVMTLAVAKWLLTDAEHTHGVLENCMVSADITLANIILPRVRGERAAAVSGFVINVGFGTFVEAAYPYMFSSKIVFAGALASATISGALVGLFDVKGTAYSCAKRVPLIICI